MSGVTDRDKGASSLLARCRQVARGARVRVGILDDAPKSAGEDGNASPYTLLEVAAVHEFGAPDAGIPQRSFIRSTVDAKAPEIAAVQHAVAVRVLKGQTPIEDGLNQIGAKVASFVQGTISAGVLPALKPETVERKGSSKPLVDTGQLRAAITWKVEV